LTNRAQHPADPCHFGSNSTWPQLNLITDGGNSSACRTRVESTFLAAGITPSRDAEAVMFDFANHSIPWG
jgi:hypothetical protein